MKTKKQVEAAEVLVIDNAVSIGQLPRTPQGKAVSWDTYEDFIIVKLRKEGGYMMERELDRAIIANFGTAHGPTDFETDRRHKKRFRQYAASAKSVLYRKEVAMLARVGGRLWRVLMGEAPAYWQQQALAYDQERRRPKRKKKKRKKRPQPEPRRIDPI